MTVMSGGKGYGKKISKKVELFTWEKLDYVEKIKSAFGMNKTAVKAVAPKLKKPNLVMA